MQRATWHASLISKRLSTTTNLTYLLIRTYRPISQSVRNIRKAPLNDRGSVALYDNRHHHQRVVFRDRRPQRPLPWPRRMEASSS